MKNIATALVGLSISSMISSMAFAAPTIELNCYEKFERGHFLGHLNDEKTYPLYRGSMPLGMLKLESKIDKKNKKTYFLDFSANGETGPDLLVVVPEQPIVPVISDGGTEGQCQEQGASKDSCQAAAPIPEIIPSTCIEVPGTYWMPAQQDNCSGQDQCQQQQCPSQEDFNDKGAEIPASTPQFIDTAKISLSSPYTWAPFEHRSSGILLPTQHKSFKISHHRGFFEPEIETTCEVTYLGN